MRTFEVKIELGNEYMSTPRHVVLALYDVCDELESNEGFVDKFQNVRDINGNRVGTYGVKDR